MLVSVLFGSWIGESYTATLHGFLGESLGYWLEGDRAQHSSHFEDGFGHVIPMVVVFLQHRRANGFAGNRGGFGGDGVALSAATESVWFQMNEVDTLTGE